jgi:hypothetical protein
MYNLNIVAENDWNMSQRTRIAEYLFVGFIHEWKVIILQTDIVTTTTTIIIIIIIIIY